MRQHLGAPSLPFYGSLQSLPFLARAFLSSRSKTACPAPAIPVSSQVSLRYLVRGLQIPIYLSRAHLLPFATHFVASDDIGRARVSWFPVILGGSSILSAHRRGRPLDALVLSGATPEANPTSTVWLQDRRALFEAEI